MKKLFKNIGQIFMAIGNVFWPAFADHKCSLCEDGTYQPASSAFTLCEKCVKEKIKTHGDLLKYTNI